MALAAAPRTPPPTQSKLCLRRCLSEGMEAGQALRDSGSPQEATGKRLHFQRFLFILAILRVLPVGGHTHLHRDFSPPILGAGE